MDRGWELADSLRLCASMSTQSGPEMSGLASPSDIRPS